ncbi:hypothetical protein D3C87_1545110 [compost metagenome]
MAFKRSTWSPMSMRVPPSGSTVTEMERIAPPAGHSGCFGTIWVVGSGSGGSRKPAARAIASAAAPWAPSLRFPSLIASAHFALMTCETRMAASDALDIAATDCAPCSTSYTRAAIPPRLFALISAGVRGPFFWVLRMSGPLLFRMGLRCAVTGRQKEVRVIQLDLGWDAPSQPVLYPLHTSVALVVAKQLCDLGGSTKGLDHFWVGHKTGIKRDVYLIVKRDV